MIGKEIKSRRNVGLHEIKELLKERKEAGELTYEQTSALDYSKKFCKLTKSKAAKLISELQKFEGIDEPLAMKIADLVPENIERLKLLISKTTTIDDSKLKEIMKTVSGYVKE